MSRLDEVTLLFSKITNKSYSASKQLIMGTIIGNAIANNDEDLLYEQVTDNVWSIKKELDSITNAITAESIAKFYTQSYNNGGVL